MADTYSVTPGPTVAASPTRGGCERYSLLAIAITTAECVAAVGGLMYDTTRAGWDVTAYIRESGDDRSLRILGAGSADLRSAAAAGEAPNQPNVLAISAALYLEDSAIQSLVNNVLQVGRDDVIVWGDTAGIVGRQSPGRHVCTRAAQIFKAHALNAANASPRTEPVEQFSVMVGGQGRADTAVKPGRHADAFRSLIESPSALTTSYQTTSSQVLV